MSDDNNESTLDKIAERVGTVIEKQETDNDTEQPAREGDEFDNEEYRRNKNDYDGDW